MYKIYLIIGVMIIFFGNLSAQVNLDSGLVAYYPFNGNANDESGNGNGGTVFGAALIADRFERDSSAYFFDGIDDYILIFQSNSLNSLQTSTISYWVKYYKPISGINDVATTVCNGPDAPDPFVDGFYTYADRSGIIHFLGKHQDNVSVKVYIDAAVPLPLQAYVFVTFVADTDSIRTYKNGVLEEVAYRDNRSISRPQENWYIGQSGHQNFPYFLNGIMDDIRIYNRVLSQAEIDSLYGDCGILGDVDRSGSSTSSDALIILSANAGLSIPPEFAARITQGYGDVDNNTLTNSTDALIILSFDAGIPVPFPVNSFYCPE